MSWLSRHYDMDSYGNFNSEEEYQRAIDNGDLKETSHGAYDSETGDEYDYRGNKK